MTSTAQRITLPPVTNIIFFGGGNLMLLCANLAKQQEGRRTAIFAAPRHATEILISKQKHTLQQAAKLSKIPFYIENDINKSQILSGLVDEYTIGIGFGETYTFNLKTIKLFNGKVFDFMVIPLPQYRGGAHFTWQILNDYKRGCWNIQIINEEMVPGVRDTGGIIMKMPYIINNPRPIPKDYFNASEKSGLNLFKKFLSITRNKTSFTISKLDETKSTYFPRLYTQQHAFINWQWDILELDRFVRAFDEPYAGAISYINGQKCHLKKCRIEKEKGTSHPFMAGLIYRITEERVYVCARNGFISFGEILDNKNENMLKKVMVGSRFYTPIAELEKANQFIAEYDSKGLVKKL